MSNVQSVMDKVRALYAKDKRVNRIIDNSVVEVRTYTKDDGVPLKEDSAAHLLLNLPCIPFNKVVQFAGKPDTGKSTVGADIAVHAQQAGFKIILWDTEDKFDASRFEKFGGRPDEVYLIETNEITVGGQLIKDVIRVIKAEEPDAKILIVWDSIGGGVSRTNAEINRLKKKNAQPGQEAKENGQVAKDIVTTMNLYPDSICLYMANQTYAKIGFMQKGDKAKGGDGVEFYSSFIVFLKRLKVLTATVEGQLVKTGIIAEATVTKNHLSRGETSIYKMRFEVTASGMKKSNFEFKKAEDGEDEEADEE